jgi:hypothetical protein
MFGASIEMKLVAKSIMIAQNHAEDSGVRGSMDKALKMKDLTRLI